MKRTIHRRPISKLLFWAPALALAALVALPLTVSAAYPPGPFPGPAPGGAFSTIVTSAMVCHQGGSLHAVFGPSTVDLSVPTGTFAECTQVTIYAADPTVIKSMIPAGSALVGAFAVGWDTGAAAAQPLTLTISNPAISTAAAGFQTTSAGLTSVSTAQVETGKVAFQFSSPMGFAVTMPTVEEGVLGSTSPPVPLPSTNTLGARDGTLAIVLLAGLATGILILLLHARDRRRRDRA